MLALGGCLVVAPLDDVNESDGSETGAETSAAACQDGEDNDGDGDTDCDDADCSEAATCVARPGRELLCDNDADDDDDGFTDCDDADCVGAAVCVVRPGMELLCDNDADDDDDGFTDCDDADCAERSICSLVPDAEAEPLCDNGEDDDDDGFTDCDDEGCLGSVACPIVVEDEQGDLCSNELDDDADGYPDCDDPGCCDTPACQDLGYDCAVVSEETGDLCEDGIDNDRDQFTDCEDPDCALELVCSIVSACATEGDPTHLGTFEDGAERTDPEWPYPGIWSTFSDGEGDISPAPGAFATEAPGVNGSSGALHVRGGASVATADLGVRAALSIPESGSGFVDLSGSTGLAFYARVESPVELWVAVVTAATQVEGTTGTCSGGCGDHFGATALLSGEWACYWLPWSGFAQASATGSSDRDRAFTQALAIEFYPLSPTEGFDFWLDDVAIVW